MLFIEYIQGIDSSASERSLIPEGNINPINKPFKPINAKEIVILNQKGNPIIKTPIYFKRTIEINVPNKIPIKPTKIAFLGLVNLLLIKLPKPELNNKPAVTIPNE